MPELLGMRNVEERGKAKVLLDIAGENNFCLKSWKIATRQGNKLVGA